jgi:hypothetical protein
MDSIFVRFLSKDRETMDRKDFAEEKGLSFKERRKWRRDRPEWTEILG